ncbi:ProQ/FinO family protein [Endozoicomonas sp. Mp262]|uniref:ProQ/FinO family protein n=1 Tax=Endozoicomonas sp. Mp262 TaxID=2919499 RepID=UPI0021D8E153
MTQKSELSEEAMKLLKKLENKPAAEIMNSEALRVVRAAWPEAFHVSSPKPLKVGIHKDMESEGLIPPHIISTALNFFTTLERYLEAVKPGAARINLSGQTAGRVRLREAVDAEIKLYRQSEAHTRGRTRVVINRIKLLSVKKAS